ncbi:hypothetical protein [Yoonia sp. R2-816]|uniref:hypothetical protein n=1 Tax=Yoonia sp. R2-816 TaxID=3342638 RepID=UPI0037272498
MHGLDISSEPVDLARIALKRLGLIDKGTERDRRSTRKELNHLFRCFDDNDRLTLPMTRIVQFAVATAMRLDEICRVEWRDLDIERQMLLKTINPSGPLSVQRRQSGIPVHVHSISEHCRCLETPINPQGIGWTTC